MLMNAAKFQGYSFYCFWVIKGKPTEGVKFDFAKTTCNFSLYRIVNNLIIYFAEASLYFSHYQFTTVLLFSYQVFRAAFF